MSAVQFDLNTSYAFDIDLRNKATKIIIRQIPEGRVVDVFTRLHGNIQRFCLATQNLRDLTVPIPNVQMVSLENFGNKIRDQMTKVKGIPQADTTLITNALESLIGENRCRTLLESAKISFLLKVFKDIGKGKEQHILKAKSFSRVKEKFFAIIRDLKKQTDDDDIGALCHPIYAENIRPRKPRLYRSNVVLLKDSYCCLEHLYIVRKDLFSEQDRAFLFELHADVTNPDHLLRKALKIPHVHPNRAFMQLIHAEKTGQTVEATHKEYESILKGPINSSDLSEQGALFKLYRIFDVIANHRALYFDKPKNFQAVKELFFRLVNELVALGYKEERSTRLVESYKCLVKLYIGRKEVLGNEGEITLSDLHFFLNKKAFEDEEVVLPDFLSTSQNYQYAFQFNHLHLHQQFTELQKMKDAHDREYEMYLDRCVRNFIAQNEPKDLVVLEYIKEDFDMKYMELKTAALSLEEDKKENREQKAEKKE